MALTGHITPQGYQDCRAKTKFFRAQHSTYHNITARLKATIHSYLYTTAQSVAQQDLLCLCQATFPGYAGMLDGLHRRCSRTSVMPTDQDIIGVSFRHTCCDGANSNTGDQFHTDTRLRVYLAQVINQLGQVLNTVDIMMWRRGD